LRAVVADIDGCLTPGEAAPWNFDVLRYVADLNRRAGRGESPFAITLCTGRQQPYVEAMMQAIDGFLPAIYENGAGLYFPRPYKILEHPAITADARARRQEIKSVLFKELVEPGIAFFQPGKELTLTLYPARAGITLPHIADKARRTLQDRLDSFSLYASVSSVEILPPGIDKGAGVEWLAREIGFALAQIGGIGDAPADATFLKRVAYSAAPANASVDVQAQVQFVSRYNDAQGVREILEHRLEQA
jgi:hydroxymethylpyrimidine pyrophosphatase-like HAD family hydrolase